jgi:hypothetical protein
MISQRDHVCARAKEATEQSVCARGPGFGSLDTGRK